MLKVVKLHGLALKCPLPVLRRLGLSSSSDMIWVCAKTPLTQIDGRGEQLMRTPMHARFIPVAYPIQARCIPPCSDHVFVAGILAHTRISESVSPCNV